MVLGYLWDMYRPSTFGFGSFEALSSSNRFAAEGGVMMSVVSLCCSDYLFSHYLIMQLRSSVCDTISFHVGAEDACFGALAECRKNGRDLEGRPIRYSVVFA